MYMKLPTVSLALLISLFFASNTAYCEAKNGSHNKKATSNRSISDTINEQERLHLIFMREEEKLARDVYIKLSIEYPNTSVFGKISVSETRHTSVVKDALERFNIEDPVINDNVGIFSGEEFGEYFTDKFEKLTNQGLSSQLDALYVGAYIEELDMMDIMTCPKVMIEQIDSINSANDCGLVYSKNRVINSLYENLLAGSENHLKAFVSNIERQIGEGAYQAQVLSQEELDKILAH